MFNGIHNYDDWKLENGLEGRRNEPIGECYECGQEFYPGDTVLEYDGKWFDDKNCLITYMKNTYDLEEKKVW